jgi:phosphoribosylformylglycinamidine synthase
MKIYSNGFYYLVEGDNLGDIAKELEIYSRDKPTSPFVEIGPHKSFSSAFSTNVIRILNKIGISNITSFEKVKIFDVNDKYDIDELVEIDYSKEFNRQIVSYPSSFSFTDPALITELSKWGISFDDEEYAYYKNLFNNLRRDPTFIELFDLCQSNSEHSRHWFFRGNLVKDKFKINQSLFSMIKKTNTKSSNSVIAFSDNSSAIKGYEVFSLNHTKSPIEIKKTQLDLVFTAETHNFPTLVYPFEGAATGIGGRIRDNHATGRGAHLTAGTAGYSVGLLSNSGVGNYPSPLKILIEASNGASDYGNKIGEPIINGFTRSFGMDIKYKVSTGIFSSIIVSKRIEYIKPIMFTGGIGYMHREHIHKYEPQEGMLVIRIGGPVYKIGLGGGFASSIEQGGEFKSFEKSAVQRGDPQYENKLNRVITEMILLGKHNPIVSIHDQGAGGLANVVKEIVYPKGANIELSNVTLGDSSLQGLEIWCSEFQESDVLLIKNKDYNILAESCKKEGVIIDMLGEVNNTGKINVTFKGETLLDLPLKEILEPPLTKSYILDKRPEIITKIPTVNHIQLVGLVEKVSKSLDVCSKRFLTNKVDRSVTGLVAQQQCVGPFHTPLSNYAVVSLSYFDIKGTAIACGEKPNLGLLNPRAQGGMSVGEMVTNMMGVCIDRIESIKCSGNWMWNIKEHGEKTALYETCVKMCDVMKEMGIGIDGGKDSLSMCVKDGDRTITSPGTLVISGYAPCPNLYNKVTPNFKEIGRILYLVHFGKTRMGGSTLYRHFDALGQEPPMLDNPTKLKNLFGVIQSLISENKILSLHDRSDGGLITTLIEMAISSNIGFNITIPYVGYDDIIKYLFNEELGIVIEINELYKNEIERKLKNIHVKIDTLGETIFNKRAILYDNTNEVIMNTCLEELRNYWEFTSFEIDKKQLVYPHAFNEYSQHITPIMTHYYLPEHVEIFCVSPYFINSDINEPPKVAIIREEGSNGDKEMMAAFYYVGCEVYNFTTNELIEKPTLLDKMRGIVFVGGFSFSDVLGAAKGWYLTINKNIGLRDKLQTFYKNPRTFSLGICNGCQLMVHEKIVHPYIKITENSSHRFESRFSTVSITKSKSILFKNMEQMAFGIWVAHGEGRFTDTSMLHSNQIVMKYSHGDNHNVALGYPDNPNGSEKGIAGICSDDGRHTAMMPHPERCFIKWQLPYLDKYKNVENSPWLYMFKNIFDWCKATK